MLLLSARPNFLRVARKLASLRGPRFLRPLGIRSGWLIFAAKSLRPGPRSNIRAAPPALLRCLSFVDFSELSSKLRRGKRLRKDECRERHAEVAGLVLLAGQLPDQRNPLGSFVRKRLR